MRRGLGAALAIGLCLCAGATGAAAKAEGGGVAPWRAANERAILEQFETLLKMKNVAGSSSGEAADIERNAAYLQAQLRARGFTARTLSAGPGTPPTVFGELKVKGARRTVIFYAHYDGQPAAQPTWTTKPWEPVMRRGGPESETVDWRGASSIDPQWRLFARSASDDKAPIQAMLSALDALKAQGRSPSVNVKVFWEGEEEAGSEHLDAILAAHAPLLTGDLFILGDGPVHQSGSPSVFYGARGVSGLELTVFGPARPLHSGHYGNWAPNPAVMLAGLIARLRDDDGRILIPGFYEDVRPLTPAERAAIAAVPDVEGGLKRDLGLGRTEGKAPLLEAIAQPALNLRGLSAGQVGADASNVISPEAKASIDFRLVPDQTPERVKARVNAYLQSLGWHVVDTPPDMATRLAHPRVILAEWSLNYPAYRTDLDAPEGRAVAALVEQATGRAAVRLPMLGGSVPMDTFARRLKMPIIGVPIANADNNQHGANENLRLQNLWDGIEIYAALLTGL